VTKVERLRLPPPPWRNRFTVEREVGQKAALIRLCENGGSLARAWTYKSKRMINVCFWVCFGPPQPFRTKNPSNFNELLGFVLGVGLTLRLGSQVQITPQPTALRRVHHPMRGRRAGGQVRRSFAPVTRCPFGEGFEDHVQTIQCGRRGLTSGLCVYHCTIQSQYCHPNDVMGVLAGRKQGCDDLHTSFLCREAIPRMNICSRSPRYRPLTFGCVSAARSLNPDLKNWGSATAFRRRMLCTLLSSLKDRSLRPSSLNLGSSWEGRISTCLPRLRAFAMLC
jgi:hypothetical protein